MSIDELLKIIQKTNPTMTKELLIWEKDDPRITKVGVLANLKNFIGRNIDDFDTDICEAFEDYDEQGETCMSCEESQDNCTYVASIDVEHSTSFVINCDSDNIIIDVWIQE